MFALNIQAWSGNDFIRANYSAEAIARLARELKKMAERGTTVSGIRWKMRQSAFTRN